jgi:hypothetical protein
MIGQHARNNRNAVDRKLRRIGEDFWLEDTFLLVRQRCVVQEAFALHDINSNCCFVHPQSNILLSCLKLLIAYHIHEYLFAIRGTFVNRKDFPAFYLYQPARYSIFATFSAFYPFRIANEGGDE